MRNGPGGSDRHTNGFHGAPVEEGQLSDIETVNNAIFNAAPDSIVAVGCDGNILCFNQAAERTFGIHFSEVIGKNFTETLIAPECREDLRRAIERSLSDLENAIPPYRSELSGRRADGTFFPAELTLTPINLQEAPVFTVFIRDLSEIKRTEALQAGQNRILNLIATGSPLHDVLMEISNFAQYQSGRGIWSICRLDDENGGRPEQCTRHAPSCYAAHPDKVIPTCATVHEPASHSAKTNYLDGDMDAPLATTVGKLRASSELTTCVSWPIFSKSRTTLGAFTFHFGEGIAGPTTHENNVARICADLAGIAIERLASEEKIRYLAHYDGLTSLPNRFLFNEYLNLAFHHARRSGKKFAVLFVDLDRFKEINDTFGHAAGDLALHEIAKRMRNCLRNSDKIARMGGDEFYVLAEELHDGCHAADIACKLLDAASSAIQLCGTEYHLSASIGISVYPQDGENVQALLKNADCAMYRAKELGKNRYQFFSTSWQRGNAA